MLIEERASTHVYRQKRMFTKEELEQREHLCVHEQPAYCVAACPLKLDTKAMMAAVAAGDFDKALALYEKITAFPNILSGGCEAPCEGKCKLCTLGDGIAISQIEAAAIAYGVRPKPRSSLRFKKKKTVAVLGSGLFALFLTGELFKKAYPITVYCTQKNLEQWIRQETDFVAESALEDDLSRLRKMDAEFRFSSELNTELLNEIRSQYDVICADIHTAEKLCPGLQADKDLMYASNENLVTGRTDGVLDAAFCAKKAALSVDRLAQKLDPSNTRGEEGTVETRLYTSLEGVEPSRRIPITDRDSAIAEASRCIQCHCDECIKGCAYLQHYNKFPRQLTREIYNNVSIIMGDI